MGYYNNQWSYVGGWDKKDEDMANDKCDHQWIKDGDDEYLNGRWYFNFNCSKCGERKID